MHIPGYTVSLLMWVLPIIAMTVFFIQHRVLTREKIFALLATILALSSIGFVLDLIFAHCFFTFENTKAVCGITICQIPIEEFVFYITGFWFILFVYVFCDEWFLLKYNVPDDEYARYRSELEHKLILHFKSLWLAIIFIALGTICKRLINPAGEFIPGYFTFLVITAYMPMFLFYGITRLFINWQAFFFTMQLTMFVSVIWEVTLAIPGKYWGYQHGAMLGIFIKHWFGLPLEAVTVWIFCTLIIPVYEFVKICYFTPISSTKK
jgi:hypothetical protein